jgi:aldehyde dehydrogenase (NAD+)
MTTGTLASVDGRLVIAGARADAVEGGTLPLTDPSTGAPIAEVAAATGADVNRAVDAARTAFMGAWGATAPAQRGRALQTIAAAIRAHGERLQLLDVLDAGLPRRMAKADAEAAARYFEFYAGAADKIHGESIPIGNGMVDFTLREPYGVCAIITPFNVPLQLMARSVAPALAAGNTVVVKAAEQAPLSVLALGQLIADTGLPPGTVNVLCGGGAACGQELVAHHDVHHVTFTGSLPTGRRVMATAAAAMTPVTMELGGKSPHLLFADADIDRAIDAIAASALLSAGQVCSAGTRILVHHTRYEEVCAKLAARAQAITIGPAIDDPEMGPVVSAAQRDTITAAVARAREAGAIELGGPEPADRLPAGDGYFVAPVVFAEVDPASELAREEVFGPVLAVLPFDTPEEAIALANDSDYGLVAGLWTRDVGRAMAAARALQAGQIFVNSYGVGGGIELPFGGYKRSGIGREKGVEALREYTQVKNVCVEAELR